jgi:hypothetical protein
MWPLNKLDTLVFWTDPNPRLTRDYRTIGKYNLSIFAYPFDFSPLLDGICFLFRNQETYSLNELVQPFHIFDVVCFGMNEYKPISRLSFRVILLLEALISDKTKVVRHYRGETGTNN